MIQRQFGGTDLRVSAIGLGTGHIGRDDQDDAAVFTLLDQAAELGITLIDTARSYGQSERRLGRWLAANPGLRDRVVISTKGGYAATGLPDWTGACIASNVDESMARLGVDRLDIFHLHSCPPEILQRDDVVRAVDDARRAGKVRVAAYSGENDALTFAISSGVFQSVQCSVNICDQASLNRILPSAAAARLGIIGKRPLANAFWRFQTDPSGDYCQTYWRRAVEMGWRPGTPPSDTDGLSWEEFAVRFAAFAPGVHSAIVGTSQVHHLRTLALAIARGPLPPAVADCWRRRFESCGSGWSGEI